MNNILASSCTKDNNNTPVRLYWYNRQVKGNKTIKIYQVEFKPNTRWIKSFESENLIDSMAWYEKLVS